MKEKPSPKGKSKVGKTFGLRGSSLGDRNLLSDRHLQTSDTEIDVMVVWTAKAECKRANKPESCTRNASTESGMRGLIDLAVEETNVAYANSGIPARLRLVHAAILPGYVEPGFGDSLSQMRSQTDGQLDYIHTWREQYGADVVAMLIDDPQYCGLGYLGPRKDLMFSVTAWNCATGLYTFGHEIGHNFGCNHDKGTTNTCSNQAVYAYGYRDPQARFRSVMAYGCRTGQCDNNAGGYCTRAQMFSTPDIQYNGLPIGAADVDNARRINEKRVEVAGYLPTRVGTPSATPTSQPTPCNGKSVSVNIKTDNYPAETSWTIQDNCGAGMVGSGSGYSERNADISELLCLPESEYTFTISDEYGDGICCGYGNGLYSLIVDGSLVKSGGQFASSDDYTFGSCSGEPPVTHNPTSQSSNTPSAVPSSVTSDLPSMMPSFEPSMSPSDTPSVVPSSMTSDLPSMMPSSEPSMSPSDAPSAVPSSLTIDSPSMMPSSEPSMSPSNTPSAAPSSVNSDSPSMMPSSEPSMSIASITTNSPTQSNSPTHSRTNSPTSLSTNQPSSLNNPSDQPTSAVPSSATSDSPSMMPSSEPSMSPSDAPSAASSSVTSDLPSMIPSSEPSMSPSDTPSAMPSPGTSDSPSMMPSSEPSMSPSDTLSVVPSSAPTTMQPTYQPTDNPTITPEATTLRTLVCGMNNKCSVNDQTAEKNTMQAVRCCRDESHGGSGGWPFKCRSDSQATYSSFSGPWAQSKLVTIPDNLIGSSNGLNYKCVETNFEGAVETCAANNARLCTPQEISDRCTRGTGCNFNSRLVWTCIAGGDGCNSDAECCSGTCGADGTCA